MKMRGFFILAAVFALVSCKKEEAAVTAREKNETVIAVKTITAEKGSINDYLKLSGDVDASESIDVYPDVAGKISRVYVKEGDFVYKNAKIADVDRNKAGMNFALSPVTTSISGTVTKVYTTQGALAAPSLPVAKVGKLNKLEIVVNISERFISQVKVGQKAEIRSEAYPDKVFEAVVKTLNPVVNPVTRSMEVRLALLTGAGDIKPGMFVDVKLSVAESKDTVLINSKAIINRNNKEIVYVALEGVARERVISTGIRSGEIVEVTEGLSEGEKIVTAGKSLLSDSMKVKIVGEES